MAVSIIANTAGQIIDFYLAFFSRSEIALFIVAIVGLVILLYFLFRKSN
jgi:hypothetical protein